MFAGGPPGVTFRDFSWRARELPTLEVSLVHYKPNRWISRRASENPVVFRSREVSPLASPQK